MFLSLSMTSSPESHSKNMKKWNHMYLKANVATTHQKWNFKATINYDNNIKSMA